MAALQGVDSIPPHEMLKLQFAEAQLRGRLDRLYALNSHTENQDLHSQVAQASLQSTQLQTQTALIAELTTGKQRLKAENELSEERFRSLQAQLQEAKANHRISHPGKEITTLQFVHRTQMSAAETEKQSLRAKLADLREYVEERSAFVGKIEALEADLEREKRQHKQELWDMNAAQIRATSRLRKEIQSQFEQTKIALLKMNDQQLEASTRMTAEENQKLVSEVDFLSKETEKLLEKNANLELEIGKMRKYAESQRQIETELVKRSKFCEKLVAEMGKRLSGLETAPDSHQSSVLKYDPDLVAYLEKKVEELTAKLETLECKNSLLRRQKQAQMRGCNSIIAALGEFAAAKAEGSDGLWRLLQEDYADLSLPQRQELAEWILQEGHSMLKPPLVSNSTSPSPLPVLASPVPASQRFQSLYEFDFDKVKSTLKPLGRSPSLLTKQFKLQSERQRVGRKFAY